MKAILIILALLAILENGAAQQLSLSARATDSIEHKMKVYKSSGVTLMAVGIAGIVGGGAWMLSSLSNDPNLIWETDSDVDYAPQYLGSMLIMAAGGVMLGVGIRKIVKGNRLKKILNNAHISASPMVVPKSPVGPGISTFTQTSLSLQVRLGK